MRIEDLSVVVRSRTMSECCDLAVAMLRRYWWQLAMLTLIGIVPISLLIALLIRPLLGDVSWFYWLLVFHFALAPIAVGPIIAFLGTAMFSRQPTIWAAWRMAYSRLGALLVLGIVRWFAALSLVAIPWCVAHTSEALILERLGLSQAFARGGRIQTADFGRQAQCLLVSAAIILLPQWFILGTIRPVVELFTSLDIYADDGGELLVAITSVISLIMSVMYLAMLRFCVYLDHRTRTEGWDVELTMRQQATILSGRLS